MTLCYNNGRLTLKEKANLSLAQLAALTALGAMWGASYIFIRMAVEPFGPVFLMFARVALTGLILVAMRAGADSV